MKDETKSAYPVASHGGTLNQGMTLREYYAGQQMAALSACECYVTWDSSQLAKLAVCRANALIEALKRTEEE